MTREKTSRGLGTDIRRRSSTVGLFPAATWTITPDLIGSKRQCLFLWSCWAPLWGCIGRQGSCGECSKTASGRCCWGRLIAASLSRSRSLSLFPLQQWSPGCFTWSGSTPRDRRQKLLELLDLKFLRFNFWNILLVEASHKAKPVLMSGDTEPTS